MDDDACRFARREEMKKTLTRRTLEIVLLHDYTIRAFWRFVDARLVTFR